MQADSIYVEDKCHKIAMFGMFQKYLRRSNMIDCRIFCEKGVLEGHKLILASSSAFFEKILVTGCSSVVLNDVTQEDMKTILQFIYSGKCVFDRNRMESLQKAANTLCIQNLVKVLEATSSHSSEGECGRNTAERQQYANLMLVKDTRKRYQDSAVQANLDPSVMDMDSVIENLSSYIDDSFLADDSPLFCEDTSNVLNGMTPVDDIGQHRNEPVETWQAQKITKRVSRSKSKGDGVDRSRGRPRKTANRSKSVPRSSKRGSGVASAIENPSGDERKSQILERIYFGYGTNEFCTQLAPDVPTRQSRSRSNSRPRTKAPGTPMESFAAREAGQGSEKDVKDSRLRPRWTEEEIDLLLRIWAERVNLKKQSGVDLNERSDGDRRVVTSQLNAMGVTRSFLQVSTKMSHLKYEYQKHLVGEKRSPVVEGYGTLLREIFGEKTQ